MNSKNLLRTSTVVIIVLALSNLTAFALPTLQNGDFSEPNLAGWNWTGLVTNTDNDGNALGYALFVEVLQGQVPGETITPSTLGQEFSFPEGALTLSFDIEISPPGDESDSFTAYLYDNSTDLYPLISNESGDEFFYINTEYLNDPDPNDPPPGSLNTVATFDGQTVTLDISGLQDPNAYLLFSLNPEIDDFQTFVELRNVKISVIPAPGALVMGGIGLGCVTWLRRRRTL